MRRVVASSLAMLVAAGPVTAAAAPTPQAATTGLAVAHSPVGCMIVGTNPQIAAGITPQGQVQVGRVYFKSALGDAFYYVEMFPSGTQHVGILPTPRAGAGPITYYVEGIGRDYAQSQTQELSAALVEKLAECGGKPVASSGPTQPVRVFSVTGSTAPPVGFGNISSVVGGTSTAGAAGAGAGGSFLTSTAGIVTLGAVALGVATVIVVTSGDGETPPVSPTR